MKYLLLILLILTTSCASVKYSSETDKNNFEKVEIGKTYVVFAENNFRKRLTVSEIEKNEIIFKDKENTEYKLPKNSIFKIRKNNTGATVISSYFGAGTLLFLYVVAIWKK